MNFGRKLCEKCHGKNVISGSDGTYCRDCGHLRPWTKKQYEKVLGKDKNLR